MEQTISTNLAEFPFSKIGGHKKVIEQLRYMIELPFKFSEIKTQKVGLLMYGQPGCGKTLIARELSKALGGCFFIIIQGPELMSQYVGQSEEKLRYAFQECLDQSFERDLPSILFIDEADAVLSKRSTSDTKYEVRFIDQFLTLMDGIYDRGNTIVICATNRPEVIDSAAKRIGRFDKEIQTNPPDSNDRVEIFKIFINEYTESVQISQDINEEFIISFCENLENFNGSDISGIFKEAYEICKRRAFKINKSGQFKKVCDLCRRIFSCHSEIHVFYTQKEVVVFNKKIGDVKNDIENQLNAQPKDLKLLIILSQIYHLYYNNYKLALQFIKQVLQMDPLNVDARLDLVDIMKYHSVGNKQDQLKILEECIELDQHYWRIYFIQLKIYDSLKLSNLFLLSKAVEFLEMFPNNLWLKTYYLQIYSDMRKPKKNVETAYLKESKYLDFEMLRRLAYMTKNQEEMDFSILCEEYSIRLNPNSFYSLNNLAYSVVKQRKDLKSGIEYYKRALEQNPKYTTTLKNLAITCDEMKDYDNSKYYVKILLKQSKLEFAYKMIINYCFKDEEFKTGIYYAKKSNILFPNQFDLLISYLDLSVRSSGYQIHDYEDFEIVSFKAIQTSFEDISDQDLHFIHTNLLYIYSQNNQNFF